MAPRRVAPRAPARPATLFLGPPGTGKTTRLLAEVDARLRAGLDPARVAYVAFTRKAAGEAAERARGDLPAAALRNFRTIHSLAYRELGLRDGDVLRHEDYRALGAALGLSFSRYVDPEETGGGLTDGDRIRAVAEYAAATRTEPEAARLALAAEVDSWRLRRYVEALAAYKRDVGRLDFNDMLGRAAAEVAPLDLDLAVIDEAQDLSALQWAATRRLFARAREVIFAGDDDQAIFRWAGADVPAFLGLAVTRREVLGVSHRVPRAVAAIAGRIAGRIATRFEKPWAPRATDGEVERAADPDAVDLARPGSWLLLARNGYLLAEWERVARAAGVTYLKRGRPSVDPAHLRAIRAWEARRRGAPVAERDVAATDELASTAARAALATGRAPVWYEALLGLPAAAADYYRAALRRGADLDAPPRVVISTIHGAKGGEADHVAVLTDRAARTVASAEAAPDDEHRVFYVAVTRSRETLVLVAPTGPAARAYDV